MVGIGSFIDQDETYRDVNVVELADESIPPARVDSRNFLARNSAGLDQEVVNRELVFPVCGGIESLAEFHELGNRDCGSDEVVRVLVH